MSTRLGTALLQTVLKFEGGKKGLVVDGLIGPRTRSAFATSSAAVIGKAESVVDSVGLNIDDIVGDVKSTTDTFVSDGVLTAEFRDVILKAVDAAKKAGLNPLAVAGQLAAESQWGRSGLSKKRHNYAGIKFNSMNGYPGKPVKSSHMLTKEFINGEMVTISDGFAVFDDVDHFIDGYLWYLLESYPSRKYVGLKNAQSVEQFFSILKRGGYATDPDYVRKGVAVANSVARRMPYIV